MANYGKEYVGRQMNRMFTLLFWILKVTSLILGPVTEQSFSVDIKYHNSDG